MFFFPLDFFTKDVWNNLAGGFWCQNSKATVADEVPLNSVHLGCCECESAFPAGWQSHQHPLKLKYNEVLNPDWSSIGSIDLDPWLILMEAYLIFGGWDCWNCFLWGWQTSSMIMRTSGATRTCLRRNDWCLRRIPAFVLVPAALRLCPLVSGCHAWSISFHHFPECIALQELTKCFEQEACRIKGSLQNVDFEDMAPRTWSVPCCAEGKTHSGRCVNICVEHVVRIRFQISKLHNWATRSNTIQAWDAFSDFPRTLLVEKQADNAQEKDTASFSCCIQESQTSYHSRSIMWRTPPVAT